MSGYVWGLPGPDATCDWYAPGHQVFWVQFNWSMRRPGRVIPVSASVDDDGLVQLEGDDLSLTRWNHASAELRAALDRFGGMAEWKSLWSLLLVPAESAIGSGSTVFHLGSPDQDRECRLTVRRDPDAPPPPRTKAEWRRFEQKVIAEQEARNAELRAMDYSHIPPLRFADRYLGGKRPGAAHD